MTWRISGLPCFVSEGHRGECKYYLTRSLNWNSTIKTFKAFGHDWLFISSRLCKKYSFLKRFTTFDNSLKLFQGTFLLFCEEQSIRSLRSDTFFQDGLYYSIQRTSSHIALCLNIHITCLSHLMKITIIFRQSNNKWQLKLVW